YYSNGTIKQIKLIRKGVIIPSKNEDDLNYYTSRFNQSLNAGDLKEANKYCSKMFRIDSTSSDAHFTKGILMFKEDRFEESINEFDKALIMEPLMRESFAYRGVARLKKHQFTNVKIPAKDNKVILSDLEVMISLPNDEQEKICSDFQQAEFLDFSEYYTKKIIPEIVSNYCQLKSARKASAN
ncbi:MAG: hypothetical protein ABIS01_09980, partial [Ferruginibacter sp.]